MAKIQRIENVIIVSFDSIYDYVSKIFNGKDKQHCINLATETEKELKDLQEINPNRITKEFLCDTGISKNNRYFKFHRTQPRLQDKRKVEILIKEKKNVHKFYQKPIKRKTEVGFTIPLQIDHKTVIWATEEQLLNNEKYHTILKGKYEGFDGLVNYIEDYKNNNK